MIKLIEFNYTDTFNDCATLNIDLSVFELWLEDEFSYFDKYVCALFLLQLFQFLLSLFIERLLQLLQIQIDILNHLIKLSLSIFI